MATHSNNLAWEIPWTEEPGYCPWGLRVRCNLVNAAYCTVLCAKSLSRVQLFVTPWTVARQAPSSVPGTLQARILEWVAIPYSRGSSQSRDQTCVFCIDRQVLYQQHHLGSHRWEPFTWDGVMAGECPISGTLAASQNTCICCTVTTSYLHRCACG